MQVAPTSGLIAEKAYVELRRRIVTLALAPGTPLREDELMRELGIGRTPLREAIKRLALESLVVVAPRSRTAVTSVEANDIVHIAEVRAELESQAAELAAQRLDDDTRERAEVLLDELRASPGTSDQEDLIRLDEAVHELLWDAAGNPYLRDTLERYYTLSLRIWHIVLDTVPALSTAVEDEAQLLDAVLGGDAARARALMREHVTAFEREIVAAFGRA